MTDWRSDGLAFKTDLTAYKITDKTTGETRIAIGKNEEEAFKHFVNVAGRTARASESLPIYSEAKRQIIERRSDFVIAISPEPAFR